MAFGLWALGSTMISDLPHRLLPPQVGYTARLNRLPVVSLLFKVCGSYSAVATQDCLCFCGRAH